MSTKRRRPSTTVDKGNTRAKRTKFMFDIDDIHIPATDKNGTILVTGAGDVGQLGLGPDILEKSRPALVSLDYEIVDVCAGAMHTVCLTTDGRVITFGCNDEGALGRNTTGEDAEYSPGQVDLPERVKQITAGDSHTVALLASGRVFAWGNFRDSHGGMGLTPKGHSEALPHELLDLTSAGAPVVKIASGADHIVMLTQHGTVYTCGCPEQGQLGRTTERSSSRNARSTYGVDQLGKFLTPAPILLKATLRLVFDDIWAGTYATFIRASHSTSGAVLPSADIYVFGLNNYYQLGLATPQPQFLPKRSDPLTAIKPEQIVSGQHHTIIRDKDGKVFALGRKEYGRLGLGEDCEDAMVPKMIDLGSNQVDWISCGATTSFAVTKAGQLFAWGMGGGGQLGTGQEDDCFKPTLVASKQIVGRKVFRVSGGGQHTAILAADTAPVAKETAKVSAPATTSVPDKSTTNADVIETVVEVKEKKRSIDKKPAEKKVNGKAEKVKTRRTSKDTKAKTAKKKSQDELEEDIDAENSNNNKATNNLKKIVESSDLDENDVDMKVNSKEKKATDETDANSNKNTQEKMVESS